LEKRLLTKIRIFQREIYWILY